MEHYSYTNTKGTSYFLNCKEQTSKSGKISRLYYFSKAVGERTLKVEDFPDGYEIKESGTSAFPILKKKVVA